MVLFGLPLFSSHLREIVFGNHICDPDFSGFYINKGTAEKPELEKARVKMREIIGIRSSSKLFEAL